MPRETAVVSARSVYTIQSCTMSRHFMQSHIRRMHLCLAVTCHLHFWQNDRDLLGATAVTPGWNGCRNKNQHRTFTFEKQLFPSVLPVLDPVTFRSRVRCSNHRAIHAPENVRRPKRRCVQHGHTRKRVVAVSSHSRYPSLTKLSFEIEHIDSQGIFF